MNAPTYGCHNRKPFKESMVVQDGWVDMPCKINGNWHDYVDAMRSLQRSPFRMAQTCQFTLTELGRIDPRCDGCTHKQTTGEMK